MVVGVSYFEKLAIDSHWVGETARVIQGGMIGLVLVAAGRRFVRAGYRLYGQILSGCGVAILYVSTYAAFNFYHLITEPVAFVLMSGVTALAAWLADRQRSQGLALVAVGGGFVTPFLLQASSDTEVALFGYEAILVAGTMFLSRRRDWPTLAIQPPPLAPPKPGTPVAEAQTQDSAPPLLEVKGLGKRFGGFVALEGIDLAIAKGERLGLIGPNGSGKSTLTRCL